MNPERHRLASTTAEQIAASADRLERQASDVRTTDKQLALRLTKEATKLRKVARGLDIQHKRQQRERMIRRAAMMPPKPAPAPLADVRESEWSEFFARRDEDDVLLGERR